jgi:hypothetical protein
VTPGVTIRTANFPENQIPAVLSIALHCAHTGIRRFRGIYACIDPENKEGIEKVDGSVKPPAPLIHYNNTTNHNLR